ncbi:MAG: hypothetical protein LBH33_01755 [Endomicrobium sp.]|nr:hypothetical protein [Endomicrobium sp.]
MYIIHSQNSFHFVPTHNIAVVTMPDAIALRIVIGKVSSITMANYKYRCFQYQHTMNRTYHHLKEI